MLEAVSCGGLKFELVGSARLVKPVVEPVAVVASVTSDVRLVGCTISLGIEPVEAASLVEAVTSDTILLRSEVRGSPVGSN